MFPAGFRPDFRPLFGFGLDVESLDDAKHVQAVDAKLEKNDFEGAIRVANQIFGFYERDKCFQKIFDDCLDKGDLREAKRAAVNMVFRTNTDAALNKILDKELEKNDFPAAINTCRLLHSKNATQKVADKIKEAKPDLETMKKIEEAAFDDLWFFPKLQKIILNLLKTLYSALGNQPEVKRLEKRIDSMNATRFSLWNEIKKPLAVASASGAMILAMKASASVPAVCGAGALGALVVLSPAARKPENLLGVAAGVAASTAGVAIVPAIGVGLGAAIVSRIPFVQSAALGTVKAGIALTYAGARATKWAGKQVINGVGGGLQMAESAIVGLAKGTAKAGSFAIDCVGSALRMADSALDKITFRT
jgi:hypothetical protein